jgi:polyisoprenoid-binding protein YceI
MLSYVVLASTIAVSGCKKTADPPAGGSATAATLAAPGSATTGTRGSATTADTDRVEVLARHREVASQEDRDADPVVVHFDRFKVTKAHFDPNNLEGGTATLVLDMTSIKTGSEERDRDLQSPDYIDVGKFATATVDVTNVKHQAGATYTADAAVAFRAVTKTYPVTFTVVSTTSDSVRIKGELTFSRLDFGVGIDPASDPTERIDTPLVIQWVLTLAPT